MGRHGALRPNFVNETQMPYQCNLCSRMSYGVGFRK